MIPEFYGDENDIEAWGWLLGLEQHFQANQIPEDEMLKEAVKGLRGQALCWYIIWSGLSSQVSWRNFDRAFIGRYIPEICLVEEDEVSNNPEKMEEKEKEKIAEEEKKKRDPEKKEEIEKKEEQDTVETDLEKMKRDVESEKYAEETDLKAKEKNKEEKDAREADQKTKEENKEEHEGEEKLQDEIRNEEENASVAEKENETEVEEKETEEKEGKKDGPNNWQYEGFHAAISSKSSVSDQVLIQLGDILDRGEDEIAILSLLRSLDKPEKVQGGAVFQVNGNHETMNVEGDFRYVESGALDECDDFLEYINNSEDDWEETFTGWVDVSERWKEDRTMSTSYWGPWNLVKDRGKRQSLPVSQHNDMGLLMGPYQIAHNTFLAQHRDMGLSHSIKCDVRSGETMILLGLIKPKMPSTTTSNRDNFNIVKIGGISIEGVQTAVAIIEEPWDPGGHYHSSSTCGSLQFKQWDPGGNLSQFTFSFTLRTR